MPETVEWLLAAGLFTTVVLGFLWLAWNDEQRQRRRLMRRSPIPIGTVKRGEDVIVQGAVACEEKSVESDTCLRHVSIEYFERKTGSDGAVTERWRSWGSIRSGRMIRLEDSTGALLVNLKDAVPTFDGVAQPIDWSAPSDEQAEFLSHHPEIDVRLQSRMREQTIRDRDSIKVFGRAISGSSGELLLDAPPKKRLVVRLENPHK